jgi:hypothetical protein
MAQKMREYNVEMGLIDMTIKIKNNGTSPYREIMVTFYLMVQLILPWVAPSI